jgi:ankyrin repeat protein
VVQYLLNHGADVNAMPRGKDDTAFNHADITPLCRAAYFNAIETMDLLIRHGAKVNSNPGRLSALIYAAENGNLEAVEMLLEHGAYIDQKWASTRPHSTRR